VSRPSASGAVNGGIGLDHAELVKFVVGGDILERRQLFIDLVVGLRDRQGFREPTVIATPAPAAAVRNALRLRYVCLGVISEGANLGGW
jgi:hypothetical protein